MKRSNCHIFCLFILFFIAVNNLKAQTISHDNVVMVSAITQLAPPKITLTWAPIATATSYKIYRKTPSATTWGTIVTTLPSSSTSYIDNTVVVGTQYEYNVLRSVSTSTINSNGYVLASISSNISYNRGYIILVVDNFFNTTLATEIAQLKLDYEKDGWFVKQVFVNRTDAVTAVKAQILAQYNADPTNTKSMILLGHVPVPYSGAFGPDGHADHQGAWPADVYYAELTDFWDDSNVNLSTAASSRNYNIPGDGKFDNDMLESDTELEVGRVDFYNLPVFAKTETQLMKKYLDKLHSFKVRGFIPLDKGIVEDNFLSMTEGFAGSAYMNFAPMFGATNVIDADLTTTLNTSCNLWAYGTGPGAPSFDDAAGIVSSTNFATDSLKAVFTSFFGSYFGDWDSQNNLLRSSLGSGTILTTSWSGRPYWHFHQMALGETIGHCSRKTQINQNTYYPSNSSTWINYTRFTYIALLGDPSLRLHYIAPPSNLLAVSSGSVINLSWSASTETVLGYNIYRRSIATNSWTQLNSATITGLVYNDNSISVAGNYEYMVRATRLQTTGSGTYNNLSLGSKVSVTSTVGIDEIADLSSISIFPNPTANTLNLICNKELINTKLILINQIGEIVFDKTINAKVGEQIQLDLFDLSSGMYYLKVANKIFKISKIN